MFQSSVSGLIGTRIINNMALTLCPRGLGLAERRNDIINCRGFTLKGLLRSTTSSPELLTCNIALVAQKDPSVAGTATVDEFFRNLGTGVTRGTDFDVALSSIEFHMLPLNTDKFTILKHQRFVLAPPSSGVAPYNKEIDWWVPLDRQLTYRDATSTSCNDQLLVLFWFDSYGALGGSASLANKCFVQMVATTFFREVNFA